MIYALIPDDITPWTNFFWLKIKNKITGKDNKTTPAIVRLVFWKKADIQYSSDFHDGALPAYDDTDVYHAGKNEYA